MTEREKTGLKYGCLTATLLPVVHLGLFLWLAVAKWPGAWPSTWSGWFGLLAASVGLVVAYLLTLALLLPVVIILSLKDRDAMGFLRWNWPIVVALLYPIVGVVFPGPFDEIIVAGFGAVLRAYFVVLQYRLLNHSSRELTDSQKKTVDGMVAHGIPLSLSTRQREELPQNTAQLLVDPGQEK